MAARRAPPKKAPPKVEKERLQFKELLLSNPNYFGSSPSSGSPVVKKIAGNTKYEELTCAGYDPEHQLLEATVHVKLPYGYGGDLCQTGSTEYVRFYVDAGAGW